MDFQTWLERIDGMAGIYAFDILADGSFTEIRLMAINGNNAGVLNMNPDAPAFYPGIPWRRYFTDLNFESYVYKCASTNNQLYSYVNAHGFWLKGFYLPLKVDDDPTVIPAAERTDGSRTVYCLYVGTMSPEVEPEFMSQQSSAVSSAVMNISIKLHQTQDFSKAMASAVEEIRKSCTAEGCALYTVDKSKQECLYYDETGCNEEQLRLFSAEMKRTPFEVALAWEEDLADSDCLLLDDLSVVRERDPIWYNSLCSHGIRNIILYGIRCNQVLVGFIWVANFDAANMIRIKETLELSSFLMAAVIANHQFVTRLEYMSRIDALTQVGSRNAMEERIAQLTENSEEKHATVGVVFADLNGLKTVNDEAGHDAGDKMLSKAASLLKIAFADHEIYRAGGDEFVIFCPDVTQEQLVKQVLLLRTLLGTTPDVSFAVGTAFSTDVQDLENAMQTADEHMYADKETYYQSHPDQDARRHGRLIQG